MYLDAALACTRIIFAGLVLLDLPIPAKRRIVRNAAFEMMQYHSPQGVAGSHVGLHEPMMTLCHRLLEPLLSPCIECRQICDCYRQTHPVRARLTHVDCGSATSSIEKFLPIICCRRSSPFHRSLHRGLTTADLRPIPPLSGV